MGGRAAGGSLAGVRIRRSRPLKRRQKEAGGDAEWKSKRERSASEARAKQEPSASEAGAKRLRGVEVEAEVDAEAEVEAGARGE